MDFSMPDCDGPEATLKIRKYLAEQADPNLVKPFICCVTAYDFEKYKKEALEAGMDHFSNKFSNF